MLRDERAAVLGLRNLLCALADMSMESMAPRERYREVLQFVAVTLVLIIVWG